MTPSVVEALAKAASEQWAFWGYNIQAMKLFLQYAENWKEWIDLSHEVKWWFTISFGAEPSPYMNPEDTKEQEQEQEDSDDSE